MVDPFKMLLPTTPPFSLDVIRPTTTQLHVGDYFSGTLSITATELNRFFRVCSWSSPRKRSFSDPLLPGWWRNARGLGLRLWIKSLLLWEGSGWLLRWCGVISMLNFWTPRRMFVQIMHGSPEGVSSYKLNNLGDSSWGRESWLLDCWMLTFVVRLPIIDYFFLNLIELKNIVKNIPEILKPYY